MNSKTIAAANAWFVETLVRVTRLALVLAALLMAQGLLGLLMAPEQEEMGRQAISAGLSILLLLTLARESLLLCLVMHLRRYWLTACGVATLAILGTVMLKSLLQNIWW